MGVEFCSLSVVFVFECYVISRIFRVISMYHKSCTNFKMDLPASSKHRRYDTSRPRKGRLSEEGRGRELYVVGKPSKVAY